MLVGHFAVGFLAKRSEPTLSLGTCLFAPVLSDLLLFVFVMIGLERIEFGAGKGAAAYLKAIDIGYSHSLLATAVSGALLASVFYLWSSTIRGSVILFVGVLSHWVRRVSGSASGHQFQRRWISALVLYARTRSRARAIFWLMLAVGSIFLTLAWVQNIMGAPPENPGSAPLASLIFFTLIVLWGFWLNRLDSARQRA
jgi:hypothetical protein